MKNLKYNEAFFNSKWLSKFINQCLQKGKKFKIEKIIYYNFFFFKKKLNFSSLFLFFEILEKIKPTIGLKIYIVSKKKTKAIPFFLHLGLQYKKALYWLSVSIVMRKETTILYKIHNEFYDIVIKEVGDSLKKKKNYYKYTILFKTVKRFKW